METDPWEVLICSRNIFWCTAHTVWPNLIWLLKVSVALVPSICMKHRANSNSCVGEEKNWLHQGLACLQCFWRWSHTLLCPDFMAVAHSSSSSQSLAPTACIRAAAFCVYLCHWMAPNAENSRKRFSKLRPFIIRLTTVAQGRPKARYWKKAWKYTFTKWKWDAMH